MEFKKIVIILGITLSLIAGILFGASYAWYAYSHAETNVKGNTLSEVPTVIFSQTEYVHSKQIIPIMDKDKYNYGNKNSFVVTLGNNLKGYETGIEILLKEVTIDMDLRIPNYKYELLQDGVVVASGNFGDIGPSTVYRIMPMTVLHPQSYPQSYNYDLYIWLSDDGSDQNNLMNKSFRAKVSINSAIKK